MYEFKNNVEQVDFRCEPS